MRFTLCVPPLMLGVLMAASFVFIIWALWPQLRQLYGYLRGGRGAAPYTI